MIEFCMPLHMILITKSIRWLRDPQNSVHIIYQLHLSTDDEFLDSNYSRSKCSCLQNISSWNGIWLPQCIGRIYQEWALKMQKVMFLPAPSLTLPVIYLRSSASDPIILRPSRWHLSSEHKKRNIVMEKCNKIIFYSSFSEACWMELNTLQTWWNKYQGSSHVQLKKNVLEKLKEMSSCSAAPWSWQCTKDVN